MKQKIATVDKLVKNKETVEVRNVEMSPLLEARLQRVKNGRVFQGKGSGEIWRSLEGSLEE